MHGIKFVHWSREDRWIVRIVALDRSLQPAGCITGWKLPKACPKCFCFHFFFLGGYDDPENMFLDNENTYFQGDLTNITSKNEPLCLNCKKLLFIGVNKPMYWIKCFHCSREGSRWLYPVLLLSELNKMLFWMLWSQKKFRIIKINSFRGDLTDISATKEALVLWLDTLVALSQGMIVPFGGSIFHTVPLPPSMRLVACSSRALSWVVRQSQLLAPTRKYEAIILQPITDQWRWFLIETNSLCGTFILFVCITLSVVDDVPGYLTDNPLIQNY